MSVPHPRGSYEGFRQRNSPRALEPANRSTLHMRTLRQEQLLEVEHLSMQLEHISNRPHHLHLQTSLLAEESSLAVEEEKEKGSSTRNVTATTVEVMEAIEEVIMAEEESKGNSPVKGSPQGRGSRKAYTAKGQGDKKGNGGGRQEKLKQDIN